jgi:N-acetylmuramoyl-L-alanine amidase
MAGLLLGACGGGAAGSAGIAGGVGTGPRPAAFTGDRALPPIPAVRGAPLAVRVQYPASGQQVAAVDSTFVSGTVGSGDATARVNGVPVAVAPNGAFLAWVAMPPASAPAFVVEAVRGRDTVRRVVPVRLPARRALPATGRLRVDSASLVPGARWLVRADEAVRVSVRAPANARAWLERPGRGEATRRPLVPVVATRAAALDGAAGLATVRTEAVAIRDSSDAGVLFATDVAGATLAAGVLVVLARGGDTVRLAVPPAELADPVTPRLVVLRSGGAATGGGAGSDTDRVVVARPTVDGTYKWLLLGGTVLPVTGRQGGFTRVRLDSRLEAWVANADAVPLPEGSAQPRRVTGGFRVVPAAGWVDVVIATGERPAFLVEPDGAALTLTLYGTQGAPEISPILGNDTLVRRIAWDQEATDRLRVTLTLSQPVFGWLVLWDEARRAFVLRLRRPPVVDGARPLAGLVVAVDPGHPPAGATGPTGLYEGDAVLPVAEEVAALLRARGAVPVPTRRTPDALGLVERTVIARRADAHAFVSIHLNALPDGVNPFTATGTSTLFFHQPSEPLARALQAAMTARFPFPDQGVHYQNLAVARPTWYPSALTEGAYLILPEVEAALRTPAFQRRYAEAIVDGLERYFAGWAR